MADVSSWPIGWFGGRWVVALAVWTLFVWGGRLRNLFIDDGGLAEASRWSLWGSVAFVALAIGVLVTGSVGPKGLKSAVLAGLCLLTIGVWLVRATDIALEDHGFGFIAVHVVLAVVSITLAVLAARSVLGSSSA